MNLCPRLSRYFLCSAFLLINQGLGLSTPVYESLLNSKSSFESTNEDGNNLRQDVLLTDVEFLKYREKELKEYYVENKQKKRENKGSKIKDETEAEDLETGAQHIYKVALGNDDVKSSLAKNQDLDKPRPFVSAPFEAIFTITRNNMRDTSWTSSEESGESPHEDSPCVEKKHPRREITEKPEVSSKTKDTTNNKNRLPGLQILLQMLRLKTKKKGGNRSEKVITVSTTTESETSAEDFTPDPIDDDEDDSPKLRKNETSQRQEIDDEAGGGLGSIGDLLPILLPVLEDLSNPDSDTSLVDVVSAGLPIIESLLGANGIAGLANSILPLLMRVLRGPDGQGFDLFAFITPLVGPLLRITGPFIATFGGSVVPFLLNILRSPDTISSIVTAFAEFLTQMDAHGNLPIVEIGANVATSLLKELKPGLPGGLDVAAITEAITVGTITGILGASGASKGDGGYQPYGPYKPYGAGAVQAYSINALQTNPGFVEPKKKMNLLQPRNTRNPNRVPGNIAEHQKIRPNTTQSPYLKLLQRIRPESNRSSKNSAQHRDPVQVGATNAKAEPDYVPYGNNGVPAYSVNPLNNIVWTIKDLFGDGTQVHSSDPVLAETDNTGSGDSSYSPYGNKGTPVYGVNPFGIIVSSVQDVTGSTINLLSSLINAVFGISGASSVEKPQPYGPSYGPPPTKGNQISFIKKNTT